LATYHLSVHEGGDGHSHGRIAASTFNIDQSFTVSGKRVEVHEHISIPSDATPGMYHFIVKAIDELGNSTSFADGSTRELEIEILASSLEDRKSTRLNSSHVKISYAVFCLKKK